jgi:hypothetical protein
MRSCWFVVAVALASFASSGLAQEAGPYKVLKAARVGGEGGWDYIYADAAGRRLYIPRRGTPASADVPTRLMIFDLDTLEPAGEIAGVGGNVPLSTRSPAMVSPAATRYPCLIRRQ